MQNQKPLAFDATAASYFIVFAVTIICVYIPIVGWAFAFNFLNKWIADNLEVNGKKVVYQATFGEAFKFTFIGLLLTAITFGIYTFWFVPKSNRFFTDHTTYLDSFAPIASASAAAPVAQVASQPPVNAFAPAAPAQPAQQPGPAQFAPSAAPVPAAPAVSQAPAPQAPAPYAAPSEPQPPLVQ